MKKHEQLGEVSSVALVAVSAIVWGSGRAVLVGIGFCALGKEGRGGWVEGGLEMGLDFRPLYLYKGGSERGACEIFCCRMKW